MNSQLISNQEYLILKRLETSNSSLDWLENLLEKKVFLSEIVIYQLQKIPSLKIAKLLQDNYNLHI